MEAIFPGITVMEMPTDAFPQVFKKNQPNKENYSSRLTINHFLEKFNVLNNTASVKETNSEIAVV